MPSITKEQLPKKRSHGFVLIATSTIQPNKIKLKITSILQKNVANLFLVAQDPEQPIAKLAPIVQDIVKKRS
jgi:hypothetical protein